MKMRFFIVLLMAIPMILPAQSSSIQSFFDAHKDNDDYTLIEVTGNLFKLTRGNNKPQGKTRIDGFQLLSAPKGSDGISKLDVKGFTSRIMKQSFEDLIVVRDADTRFNFMAKESGGIISELVMIADSEESITVMSLFGRIPTEELRNLHDEVDIDGLEHLNKN